jgi:hypothetical protein
MTIEDCAFRFDWRLKEHARVTSLLLTEQVNRGIGRIFKWSIAVFLVLASVVTAATAIAGDLASTLQLGPLVIVVAVLTSKFPEITGWLQAWRVGRSDPNVGHEFVHTFGPAGLRIGMHTVDAELKWAGMHEVRETADMFLFYYSERLAYYLPKRVVAPPEVATELPQWIRARLPPSVPYIHSH